MTKAAQIRKALGAGELPKDIAKKLKVTVARVYNERWKLAKKKNVGAKSARGGRPKKVVLNQQQANIAKDQDIYIDDLMEIRRQIDDLRVIEAFLQVRIQQLGQNVKWQTTV